ncbi:hypothetical protein FI667_g13425, partial [Globisporangium splendens]
MALPVVPMLTSCRGRPKWLAKRPQFSNSSTKQVTMEIRGEQITFDQCYVTEAISACVNGEVGRVQAFLNKFHGTGRMEACGEMFTIRWRQFTPALLDDTSVCLELARRN